MNKNIYLKELRLNLNSFLIWSSAVGGVIMLGMAFYPVLTRDNMLNQLTTFLETPFMKSIMSAFGASIEVLTNVLGFYSTRNAVFVMLMGGFFAVLLAGRIVAREEGEKSAEFLLTKPVTRIEVILSKSAVFLTYLVLLNAVILLFGYLSLELFRGESEYSLAAFLVHTLYGFLLMLLFGTLGLFASLWIKRGRSISGLAIGLIVGSYFIDALSKIEASVDKIGYLSPFKFVRSDVLNAGYGLDWWRLLYFIGLSAVLFALCVLRYRKKDILT